MGNGNFNPWSFGAGVLNAGVSIWSQHQQNKNIDKQLSAQQRENANNRAYNLKLAKMQNAWNRQQWNMENAYNSPAAQIERLKAAGLNPDMMYGGPVSGNLSASSPQMTSGAPSSPMDWTNLANKVPVGVGSVDSFLDSKLKQAQIDNINADTEKKGAETSILSDDALFRKEYNQGLLSLQDMEIRIGNSKIELTDAEIKESQARLQQIEATVSNLNASTSSLLNAITNDNARLVIEKSISDAQIREIASRYDLNYTQVKRYTQELDKVLRKYDDEHEVSISLNALYGSQKTNIDADTDNKRVENGLLTFHKDGAKFKLDVATLKKKDLTNAQTFIRVNDELFKAVLNSL